MKRRTKLSARVVLVPHPDADAHRKAAIQLLARALADKVIAEARESLAAELGVSASSIDRERGLLADDDLAFLDAPLGLGGAA